MPQYLTFGLLLICRTILWLAGCLALLGLLWRNPVEASWLQNGCVTLILTVLVEFLMLLPTVFSKTEPFIEHYVFWVPALFIGFLLPPPWLILYIVLLGMTETVRRIGISQWHNFSTGLSIQKSDTNDANKKSSSTTQEMTRYRTKEGKDHLEGNFLIEFHHDQWTVPLHVPFCPAFDAPPNIEVFLLDDVDIKWKIFEPRTFGVRIDIKRGSREISRCHLLVIAESF